MTSLADHAETNEPYRRPLRVLLYDIETAPLEARLWRPNQDFIPHNMMREDYFILTWAAKWWGQDQEIMSARVSEAEAKRRDDQRIVKKLGELMIAADVLVAHYGNRFDWPKVNGRLLYHGLEPLGKKEKIDTKNLASRHFGFSHNNLDYLGRMLGEGEKLKTGWDMWVACVEGDVSALRAMEEYNRGDVDLLDRVFTRLLPYVDGVARLFDAAEYREDVCAYCGSKQSRRKGFYRTKAGTFPKFQCRGKFPNGTSCGKYRRGRRSIGHRAIDSVPL